MPACPRCQTPYASGARFCQQCGAFLLEDEEPTGAATGPEAGRGPAAPGGPKPPPRRWSSLNLALIGLAGIFILVLAVFIFTRDSGPPPVTPKAPAPEASIPAADLQMDLAQLLSTLRKAQINQDISLFMSCYAAAFDGREEKGREALKAWEGFDFTAMFFYLEDVKSKGPEAAQARVTWDLQVQDKLSGEYLTAIQIYQAEFVKEQGAWRIRALEEIRADQVMPPAPGDNPETEMNQE
jgi:hypothetical protein